jgi:hypothetical protein
MGLQLLRLLLRRRGKIPLRKIVCLISHVSWTVPPLMFGAGDSRNPYDETIELLDEIAVDFIVNLV